MNEPLLEKRTTWFIFLFAFLSGASYVMMRAVAVSLFLSRAGADRLPSAFAASAVGVILVTLASSGLARVLSGRVRTAVSWAALAVASVSLEVGCAAFPDSILVVTLLYVLADVRGSLGTIYLATLASEQFADEQSKRPFTIVASGPPLAGIVVGLSLGAEASFVGILPVLIAVAVIDVVAAMVAALTPRKQEGPKQESQNPPPAGRSDSGLRWGVSGIIALKILTLTLITFQWEVAAAGYFGQDETAMVAYFAFFFGISDLLIVTIQWFIAGELLDRFGLRLALCGFPILIAVVGVAAFVVDSAIAVLAVFTVAKGLNVFRRAFHDPALTAIYSTLHPRVRDGSILLNKGIIKPMAEAAAIGLMLAMGVIISDFNVTWLWLLLAFPWLYAGYRTAKRYRRANRSGQPVAGG